MTWEEEQERKGRTYKLLLWFGMISVCMIFAGLTSAYVVSKSRPDWLSDFVLPTPFLISTLVMLITGLLIFIIDYLIMRAAIKNFKPENLVF